MMVDADRIRAIVAAARRQGRGVLLETEGLMVLEALGIPAPAYLFVRNSAEAGAADLSRFRGERVVVKVISPCILHKSDVGGVAVVAREQGEVAAAVRDMETRLGKDEIAGFTINQFVTYDRSLGSELLLGLRWTDDFGPVVTLGAGGIYTEFLAANFRPGREIAIVSPELAHGDGVASAISRIAVTALATGRLRGQPPRLPLERLVAAVETFMALGASSVPADIAECEINPLVIAGGSLVALDILVKLGQGEAVRPPARPIFKLKCLLEPRSAAIIGVSEKLNPGHIILRNLIREGFDRDRIYVVKPGSDRIEGCRCLPEIASLPEKVDLFILAVSAAQAPEVVADVIEREKAESLIVIPGGLEEKRGTEALVARMRGALASARASDWQGPLINGGNCLGIRSLPGHYDTMFIPEFKLPVPSGRVSPLAIISQSGAFAVARMSKIGVLNPKYAITVGNQMDLTVGDYLAYLKDDPEIEIFAVYVEGFAPLDGLTFLDAAQAITTSGRTVILYRAGRTAAGAQASQSHTASIAGDYAVTRELARSAGVVLAESLQEFDDLTRLFTFLRGKEANGWRLGAISNAGFECVAIADNLGRFELAVFDEATTSRLEEIFRDSRIDSVVDVHNPLDLTPMTGDTAYEQVVRTVIGADTVDVGIVGMVPLTVAMNTLPPGDGHREDVFRDDSTAGRMAALMRELPKAWVAVVDAGPLYDPLARLLEQGGVPTFRTADSALRLLNRFCEARAPARPVISGQ
jgi:acyl-CoA synthetase (NDP forming)